MYLGIPNKSRKHSAVTPEVGPMPRTNVNLSKMAQGLHTQCLPASDGICHHHNPPFPYHSSSNDSPFPTHSTLFPSLWHTSPPWDFPQTSSVPHPFLVPRKHPSKCDQDHLFQQTYIFAVCLPAAQLTCPPTAPASAHSTWCHLLKGSRLQTAWGKEHCGLLL